MVVAEPVAAEPIGPLQQQLLLMFASPMGQSSVSAPSEPARAVPSCSALAFYYLPLWRRQSTHTQHTIRSEPQLEPKRPSVQSCCNSGRNHHRQLAIVCVECVAPRQVKLCPHLLVPGAVEFRIARESKLTRSGRGEEEGQRWSIGWFDEPGRPQRSTMRGPSWAGRWMIMSGLLTLARAPPRPRRDPTILSNLSDDDCTSLLLL